jgi:hypothetical protein
MMVKQLLGGLDACALQLPTLHIQWLDRRHRLSQPFRSQHDYLVCMCLHMCMRASVSAAVKLIVTSITFGTTWISINSPCGKAARIMSNLCHMNALHHASPRTCNMGIARLLCAALLFTCSAWAARDGVYVPDKPIEVHYWTGTEKSTFVYPEQTKGEWGMPSLLQKPNLGIAVSGGGFRATTLALGWVRALYEVHHGTAQPLSLQHAST